MFLEYAYYIRSLFEPQPRRIPSGSAFLYEPHLLFHAHVVALLGGQLPSKPFAKLALIEDDGVIGKTALHIIEAYSSQEHFQTYGDKSFDEFLKFCQVSETDFHDQARFTSFDMEDDLVIFRPSKKIGRQYVFIEPAVTAVAADMKAVGRALRRSFD